MQCTNKLRHLCLRSSARKDLWVWRGGTIFWDCRSDNDSKLGWGVILRRTTQVRKEGGGTSTQQKALQVQQLQHQATVVGAFPPATKTVVALFVGLQQPKKKEIKKSRAATRTANQQFERKAPPVVQGPTPPTLSSCSYLPYLPAYSSSLPFYLTRLT